MYKKIKIIGIGMDGSNTLTQAGRRGIEEADLLIGAQRMLLPFKSLGKSEFVSYICEDIVKFIQDCEYKNIAVLVSGDCGFYSATEKLLPLLEDFETEVICGISAPIYFCSRLQIPWSRLHFVSLHGASGSIVRNVCSHEFTFFLLGGKITPSEICRRLCEYSMGHITVHIGENLAATSAKGERILSGRAEDFIDVATDNLCVMIVQNPHYERYIRCGIDDGEFIRGKVPMTKSEVRALCVSKLDIHKDDTCWDIGCGTGSVSVEMALRCTNGTVFAVDKNSEAVELTELNSKKFGCDNIKTIRSLAENVVEELSVPDCVFIGGSGGCIENIIRTAVAKNSYVKIVATAVSLETLFQCIDIFNKLGFQSETVQIAVTQTRKIGSHTMFCAENPIFIIKRKFCNKE